MSRSFKYNPDNVKSEQQSRQQAKADKKQQGQKDKQLNRKFWQTM